MSTKVDKTQIHRISAEDMSERLHTLRTRLWLCCHDCIIGQVAACYSQLGSLGVDRRDYLDRVGALRPLIMQSKWVDKNHFFLLFSWYYG